MRKLRRAVLQSACGAGLLLAGAASTAVLGFGAITAQETVIGRVISLTCYAMDKSNTGHDHEHGGRTAYACDWAVVKWEGQPAGLLTSDGRLYQITGGLAANNNARIAQHLAQTVRITGEVSELDGMMMLESADLTVVEE